MHVYIDPFSLGSVEDSARKVCEEAMEMYAAHSMEFELGDGMKPLMLEIGDVITATANYCHKRGIDLQQCVNLSFAKNSARGYYDLSDDGVMFP